jgi:hypothetical protein
MAAEAQPAPQAGAGQPQPQPLQQVLQAGEQLLASGRYARCLELASSAALQARGCRCTVLHAACCLQAVVCSAAAPRLLTRRGAACRTAAGRWSSCAPRRTSCPARRKGAAGARCAPRSPARRAASCCAARPACALQEGAAHAAGTRAAAPQVLQLGPGCGAQQARQAYRRLAALVHPDKCALPDAAAAFKALGAAGEQAARQLDAGSSGGGAAAAAAAGGSPCAAGRGADGPEETDDWGSWADGPAAWWHPWEADGAQAPSTEPSTADRDRDEELQRMGLEQLRGEVARRQAAVLQPELAEERGMGMHLRQKRLRVARSVLAARLAAGAAEEGGGGGGGGGQAGGGFVQQAKRQRLG